MKTTTYARRLLTHTLALLMLVGTVGSLGVIRGEAASPSNLSARPSAGHTAHTGAASASHGVRLSVASGTSAEYRAREQLTFFSFPTDAVGTTTAVKGSIVLDAHGRIVPAKSTFVIDLRTLTSDRSQRDQFIQANTLQTAQYPEAVFSVQRAVGLPSTLPTSGTVHHLDGHGHVGASDRDRRGDDTHQVNGVQHDAAPGGTGAERQRHHHAGNQRAAGAYGPVGTTTSAALRLAEGSANT